MKDSYLQALVVVKLQIWRFQVAVHQGTLAANHFTLGGGVSDMVCA